MRTSEATAAFALLVGLLSSPLASAVTPDGTRTHLDWLGTRRLVEKFHAEGVQHYECNGKEWAQRGPSAVLKDPTGKVVATHYGCDSCAKPSPGKAPAFVPAWNFFDGGKAEGTLVDKDSSPVKGAIPHLSLKLEGNGKGRITGADHVLRVATSGGAAPAKEKCASAADAGKWASMPYQADYEFRDSTAEQPQAAAAQGARPSAADAAKGAH